EAYWPPSAACKTILPLPCVGEVHTISNGCAAFTGASINGGGSVVKRFLQRRTHVLLGVGVLALVLSQGQRVEAQFAWHGPSTITTGVVNNPSFVQAIPGTYGTKGNYELVVPLQSGGIGQFFRDNDDANVPWSGPFVFATDQGAVD